MQSSALAIPSQESELAQRIDEAWPVLAGMPPGVEVLRFTLTTNPALKGLRALADRIGVEKVDEAIRARRDGLGEQDPDDLLGPEWRVFSAPEGAPELPDFKLRSVAVPAASTGALAEVVLVERLRAVSALRGFTRINAPDEIGSTGGTIVRLARQPPQWLPCSEVRGEGIFVRFPEERLLDWEARYRQSGRAGTLRDAHVAWRERSGLEGDEGWPGERYILLHTFSQR